MGNRPVGWQIVETETDNPPEGMMTYELYTLDFCLGWLAASPEERAKWRLLPCFEGDVEEPTFVGNPDQTSAELLVNAVKLILAIETHPESNVEVVKLSPMARRQLRDALAAAGEG